MIIINLRDTLFTIMYLYNNFIYIPCNTKVHFSFQYFLRLLLPAGNDLTFQFDWTQGNSSSIDVGN